MVYPNVPKKDSVHPEAMKQLVLAEAGTLIEQQQGSATLMDPCKKWENLHVHVLFTKMMLCNTVIPKDYTTGPAQHKLS